MLNSIDDLINAVKSMPADEITRVVNSLPANIKNEAFKTAHTLTKNMLFVPNPGAQTRAYLSKADILLFGGEPGGGKSGLLCGLALNEHHRSLLIRKQFNDVQGLFDNTKEMVGSSDGFSGGTRPTYKGPNGKVIHFQGLQSGGEEFDTGKQGTPHDFIGVDEGAQLPENAIRLLIGWNRTSRPGQRCRMVIASNPPIDAVGDWLAAFFAPWLDPEYPRPAKQGELRWFIMNEKGESEEVGGPEIIERDGIKYYPHSRTYIHSPLDENKYIDSDKYRSKLNLLPEPYRTMLTSGNFMLARKDQDFQVIPTEWVIAAQARWTERPPPNVAMTAIGYDPAGGGHDSAELAMRYGGWYAPLVSEKGKQTADGSHCAGMIAKHRRDNCIVVVDVGGGYGGGVTLRLKDNNIQHVAFNGAHTTSAKTIDSKLALANERAKAYWRFREALDPNQEGGSCIALPPDTELRADLCAPRWELRQNGIILESKEKIRERLGRSPGKGDAVVMCLAAGGQAHQRANTIRVLNRTPQVIAGIRRH